MVHSRSWKSEERMLFQYKKFLKKEKEDEEEDE